MMALMAGLLPNGVIAVSAHAVLMNVSSLVFMFFLGISVTGNIRVGNALGANQPKKARMISHLTLCIVFFLACLISFCIYFLRHEIPKILINDPIAIEHASIALVVLVPYVMVDAMNCVIQGIFRGVGRQNIAAKINFFAFYIVGLPLSALLAFNTSFGVEGLWMGFGVGILISMCTSLVFLSHSSWEKMAQEAFKRITH
jgi:MATE family multidrug resistance protein